MPHPSEGPVGLKYEIEPRGKLPAMSKQFGLRDLHGDQNMSQYLLPHWIARADLRISNAIAHEFFVSFIYDHPAHEEILKVDLNTPYNYMRY